MAKKKSMKQAPASAASVQDLERAQTSRKLTQPPSPSATDSDTPPTSAMAAMYLNESPLPRKRRRDIVNEFNRYFGEQTKLENWQRLCRDVGVQDDLTSIAQCRLELKKVWVNIYDLIDAVNANTTPQIFPSLSALRAYTLEEGKIFPKKEAKKGGPVKSLLAHIFVRGGK